MENHVSKAFKNGDLTSRHDVFFIMGTGSFATG